MRGMLYEGVHAGYVIQGCACGVCYTRVCMWVCYTRGQIDHAIIRSIIECTQLNS